MEHDVTGISLAAPDIEAVERDGALYLRSRTPLGAPPPTLGALLRRAAAAEPERVFLAEAPGGALREVTYAEALTAAERIAGALVARGWTERPILVASGNSVDHALLALGAMLAGVPVAPVSAAYSLRSSDYGKLRAVFRTLRPGVIFAEAEAPFRGSLDALGWDGPLLTGGDGERSLRALIAEATPLDPSVEARVGPDSVAKVLFTSGSTGEPKGVPNTHRMLCANQQSIAQVWPFLARQPPVLVDWLPWSHTFGGNHNFNMVLFHGGTLFIDDGKPLPGLVEKTIANLERVPPTVYFNVPAGFASLVPRLEADDALRDRFFSRLQVVFYAGAALPDDLWQRLSALAAAAESDLFLTTAWGSTETSPLATSAHFPLSKAGNIGVPVPGVELKLVAHGDKREIRVKGPSVMRGYLDNPEATAAAFDEEGYYRIGDAMRLADPDDPSRGLLFDGRVAEDFKLTTGTWVNVGRLRTAILAATSPALADLVVAGADRDAVTLLAWPNPAGCRQLGAAGESLAELARHPAVRAHVRSRIASWNAKHRGASARIRRALLLEEPASIDAGEITDKGYVNQRTTLARRASLVAALYEDRAPADALEFDPA